MIRKILRLPSGRFGVALLLVVLLLAVFGPALAPYDPLATTKDILQEPSLAHWLGTDYLGRDTLSRLLAGSTLSVVSAAQVGLIALFVGAIPGILSVYLGRTFEWLTLRIIDTLIALPFLVFAVAMTALLGNGLTQAMFAVGILVAPVFYRVARAATQAVATSAYVEAAVLSGAGLGWIVRTHVWGKVLPPIAIALANTLGIGLVAVAALSFLGIGVQPPTPTWGGLLASDLGFLTQRPFAPVFPSAVIVLTVWGLNILADAIRDVSGESGRALLARTDARRERRRTRTALPTTTEGRA
jgi:peptide/nickel transport system permease protein